MKKLALTEDDYLTIETKCQIKPGEEYAVTYSKIRTRMVRTVHVFERKADARELTAYERDASKLKIRGKNAEVEGGAIAAASTLYKALIARVYDVVEGRLVVEGPLMKADAIARVDPMAKRAALRDLIGEVYSASQIADQEEDDPEVQGKNE